MEKKTYHLKAGELNANSLGQALLLGQLVATVESKKTGKRIEVRFACKAAGPPRRQGDRRSWNPVSYPEADKVFVDVPLREGGKLKVGSQVASWDLTGDYAWSMISPYGKEGFDEARIAAALVLLDVAAGRRPLESEAYLIPDDLRCFSCGGALEADEREMCDGCLHRFEGWEPPASRHEIPDGKIARSVETALGGAPAKAEEQMSMLTPGQGAQSAMEPWGWDDWYDRDEAKFQRRGGHAPRAHRDDYLKRLDEEKSDG